MNNDIAKFINNVMAIVGVVLTIFIVIGFFYTPFDNGKAIMLDSETVKERQYVEKMNTYIEKFTQQTLQIKETNELANQNKITPIKLSQTYSEIFKQMTDDYNTLSVLDVPERFKQFHVSYLKTMEYQGAAINETLTYLKDKEPSHLSTVQKYNDAFVKKYNDSITLFNRLLQEKKIK